VGYVSGNEGENKRQKLKIQTLALPYIWNTILSLCAARKSVHLSGFGVEKENCVAVEVHQFHSGCLYNPENDHHIVECLYFARL